MILETNNAIMGQNIYFLRNKKRLSRAKFSKMVDISPNLLYCIEKGLMHAIDSKSLRNICNLFGVSTESLTGEDLKKK